MVTANWPLVAGLVLVLLGGAALVWLAARGGWSVWGVTLGALGAVAAVVGLASIAMAAWGRFIGFRWHFTP